MKRAVVSWNDESLSAIFALEMVRGGLLLSVL